MKGFEVGKRVRAKEDIVLNDGQIVLKRGAIIMIEQVHFCGCGMVSIYWGVQIQSFTYCHKCGNEYAQKMLFRKTHFFDPINDDEIEIQSDTFRQVTFTKVIENVPAGVN